jgi:hypothetical protein
MRTLVSAFVEEICQRVFLSTIVGYGCSNSLWRDQSLSLPKQATAGSPVQYSRCLDAELPTKAMVIAATLEFLSERYQPHTPPNPAVSAAYCWLMIAANPEFANGTETEGAFIFMLGSERV